MSARSIIVWKEGVDVNGIESNVVVFGGCGLVSYLVVRAIDLAVHLLTRWRDNR